MINSYKETTKYSKDLEEFYSLALEENNKSLIQETLDNIKNLKNTVKKNEIKCFLSKETDSNDCFLEIHAGAGGTESQDWAEMLRRMYMKWAQSKEFKNHIISEHKGDEAGLKSSTIKISGDYVFGWLKTESGIHRLVRISPFDSQSRRHTSFASVSCYPSIDNEIKVEIKDKDLRIDTFRASGAGGQHVNKTDSAVRITHIPTKIIAQCQSNRSQHRNKIIAMEMLQSKLYEVELIKEEEKNKRIRENRSQISWGNQIRSYVMQPYQMVKDHRTNYEESNVNAILNGKLDKLLEQQLMKQL